MAENYNLVIVIAGKDYPISGSGGIPAPNSVGTEQIIDGAVAEQDLHDDVKERMTITHDSTTGGLRIGGYAKPGDIPSDGEPVGQGSSEDKDDSND